MAGTIPPNIVIDQARDWYLTVTYQTSSGTPINLTGYTANFAMSQGWNNATVLTLASGSGITITGSTGTINLYATQAQTSIPAGTYTAELVINSGSSIETSILKGNVTVSAKVVQ